MAETYAKNGQKYAKNALVSALSVFISHAFSIINTFKETALGLLQKKWRIVKKLAKLKFKRLLRKKERLFKKQWEFSIFHLKMLQVII